MTDKPRGFYMRETVGLGIPNPGTVGSVPITPEMQERIQAKADEAGMTFEEYLEHVFEQPGDGDAKA